MKNKTTTKTPAATKTKNPAPNFKQTARYRVRVSLKNERGSLGYVASWMAGDKVKPASLRLSESGGMNMTKSQAEQVILEINCSVSEYKNHVAILVGPERAHKESMATKELVAA